MIDNEQEYAPDSIYLPLAFKRDNESGEAIFSHLIETHSSKIIIDQFALQKKELFKVRSVNKRLSNEELDGLYFNWESDQNPEQAGVWVFYSWLGKLVHILDKD
ncbi:MAG: hypothetical protein NVSMB45_09020 [Ginsengibacter sp.]